MNCPECDSEVSADKNFCAKCGAAMSDAKSRFGLLLGLCLPIILVVGGTMFLARTAPPEIQTSQAVAILKDLVSEKPPVALPLLPAIESSGCPVAGDQQAVAKPRVPAQKQDEAQRKIEELQRQLEAERSQRRLAESSYAADAARLRAEAEAMRQELVKTQEESQKNTSSATEPTKESAAKPAGAPKPYTGPSSGEIVWQGDVKGYQLVEIQDDIPSSGRVTSGKVPGVACFIQPSDPKKVVISDGPRPSNGFRRLVFRVQGNGSVTVRFSWVIQK
jgi:hypothetical protein